jgi:hypothetical protein
MRRALATALITMAAPATALAAKPYANDELTPTAALDKAFMAQQRAQKAKRLRAAPPKLFQMTISAWRSVGGRGDPAAAPIAEQVRRAAALYAQAGPGQWPACGR